MGSRQRAIYVFPNKALCKQKFQELSKEFGDVGIITADTRLNPDAACLLMTTSVYLSTLYCLDDAVVDIEHMQEVEWVIFDNVDYMRYKG